MVDDEDARVRVERLVVARRAMGEHDPLLNSKTSVLSLISTSVPLPLMGPAPMTYDIVDVDSA
jgi:hypothetical protein